MITLPQDEACMVVAVEQKAPWPEFMNQCIGALPDSFVVAQGSDSGPDWISRVRARTELLRRRNKRPTLGLIATSARGNPSTRARIAAILLDSMGVQPGEEDNPPSSEGGPGHEGRLILAVPSDTTHADRESLYVLVGQILSERKNPRLTVTLTPSDETELVDGSIPLAAVGESARS